MIHKGKALFIFYLGSLLHGGRLCRLSLPPTCPPIPVVSSIQKAKTRTSQNSVGSCAQYSCIRVSRKQRRRAAWCFKEIGKTSGGMRNKRGTPPGPQLQEEWLQGSFCRICWKVCDVIGISKASISHAASIHAYPCLFPYNK